jgi:hypothetical protein
MTEFRNDGPHSPALTRAAAERASELAKFLAYATRPGSGGLETPEDVAIVLGSLELLAGCLRQACAQMGAFPLALAGDGRLRDDERRDPEMRADLAALHLEVAAARAGDMARALGKAHAEDAHLAMREDGTDV